MENFRRGFWEQAGEGSDYNAEWKARVVKHIKKILDKGGISLGSTFLDLGSGKNPVSSLIAPEDSKSIYVDFNPPSTNNTKPNVHIDRDIHALVDKDSFASKRSVVEVAKFLEIDPRQENTEQVNTVVISDILNYVPAQEVIEKAWSYLKEGGVIIVFNQPGRTFDYAEHSLSPEGARDNESIMQLLSSLGASPVYEQVTNENYFIGVYQKTTQPLNS